MRWEHLVAEMSGGTLLRPVILDSWRRSFDASVPRGAVEVHRIPRAELERRLRRSERLLDVAARYLERLMPLIGAAEHVAYVTDADGIVLFATAAAPELLETFQIHPGCDWSERRMGTNGAGTALVTGRPVAVVGEEHYLPAFHDCTCTGAPIHGPSGELIGAIDVSSPRRVARPERMLLVSWAAHAIARDLAWAPEPDPGAPTLPHAHASQAALAMVAHELRQPLASLANLANLSEGDDDLMSREDLARILRQEVERIARLTDDLLQVSRFALGDVALQRERVDLAALIAAVVAEMRPTLQARQQQMELRIPEEPVGVSADPLRVRQVVANLLDNACKYTEPGGRIRTVVRVEAEQAVFEVRDSGCGIAPEDQDAVFGLFHRGAHAQSGLGVGLFLVRQLVERHGGSVALRSEGAGKGSEFAVRLPLDATGPARRSR